MKLLDQNTKISMVSTDGSVKFIPLYLKDSMLEKGWKIIVNAKESYYPAYDMGLKQQQEEAVGEKNDTDTINLEAGIDADEYLNFEAL